MKNLYRATVLMLSLLASFSAVGAGPSIWAQLKQGGYVILMRHAPVDTMTHSTHPRADFENCVGQNN